jgi:threonine aldolase
VSRLGEDHERARKLARGLAENPSVQLDSGLPVTNMVFLKLRDSVKLSDKDIAAMLRERGILVSPTGPGHFRLVTHYWIDDAAIDKTIAAFAEVLT